jgi:hypothetical protein
MAFTMSSRIIRHANTVKTIHVPGVDCLMVKYAAHYAYALNSQRAIENTHAPDHEKSKRRWAMRTDPLWWNCLASINEGGKKKVVRGWMMNRARVAFKDALQRKGYAPDGSRLANGSEDPAKGDLIGTIHFLVNASMLRTSFQKLQEQADLIVDAIEKRQRNKDGSLQVPVNGTNRAARRAEKQPPKSLIRRT